MVNQFIITDLFVIINLLHEFLHFFIIKSRAGDKGRPHSVAKILDG